jgi:hypothetical protein
MSLLLSWIEAYYPITAYLNSGAPALGMPARFAAQERRRSGTKCVDTEVTRHPSTPVEEVGAYVKGDDARSATGNYVGIRCCLDSAGRGGWGVAAATLEMEAQSP